MEEEIEKLRYDSLIRCERLLNAIKNDQEDIGTFFGGELYDAYATATDKVLYKVNKVRTKIRNL